MDVQLLRHDFDLWFQLSHRWNCYNLPRWRYSSSLSDQLVWGSGCPSLLLSFVTAKARITPLKRENIIHFNWMHITIVYIIIYHSFRNISWFYLIHWSSRTNPINTKVIIRTILFSSCLKMSSLPSTESWLSCSLIVDELLSFTEPMPSFHTILSSKTYHWISSISTCKNIEILVIWFAWYWIPNVNASNVD